MCYRNKTRGNEIASKIYIVTEQIYAITAAISILAKLSHFLIGDNVTTDEIMGGIV